MSKFGGALVKVGVAALAAYAGYLAYNKFVKKTDNEEDCDFEDQGFNYDNFDESFGTKIRKAAQRQIDKIK